MCFWVAVDVLGLPVDVKSLHPVADDFSTSVLDHRKRIVEKVELAQNLVREFENIQRSQQEINWKNTTIVMRVNLFLKLTTCLGLQTKNEEGPIKETPVL